MTANRTRVQEIYDANEGRQLAATIQACIAHRDDKRDKLTHINPKPNVKPRETAGFDQKIYMQAFSIFSECLSTEVTGVNTQ